MFVKLAVLACTLGVSLAGWHGPLAGGAPAAQYPAGVSPHACPNYPHCSNPAVAVGGHAGAWNGGYAGGWNGAGAGGAWNGGWNGGDDGQWHGDNGQWNGDNGQWNQGAWNHNGLDAGEYTGDGDYHGEGLAESGAYGVHDGGYGGAWNGGAGAYAGAYGHHAAAVPAGVDPHSCPNYPFCH